MSRAGRPRRRPPWWPDDEQWPPQHWRGSWAERRRRGVARPFGCAVLAFVVLAAGALTLAAWGVLAATGLVSAPRPVVSVGVLVTIVIVFATARAFVGMRRMSVPIDDMADAAERIERGDYSTRVPETGPARVRILARAFNDMSARLAAVDEGRRAFLADAAHELRTPLSIVKAQIEAIEDGLYPADHEHLAPVHEQIRILEKLIDDMRTVALAESGGLALDRRPLDLSAIVEQALAALAPEAGAAKVRLSSLSPAGLPRAMADEQRVRQVLANLLSNAIRHVERGGWVAVSLKRIDDAWLQVEVADSGTGIPAEMLPKVFERFAREPGSPGSGLGLAICRDLVEAHGGRIWIESAPGTGTTVKFTLPSVRASS